jgi:hypothetical protein
MTGKAFQPPLTLLGFLAMAWLVVFPALGADVAGVRFEDRVRIGDADLLLNGVGVRSMFVIKIYALGLYLPQKTQDAHQAVSMPGAKRLRLVTLREVEAERFLDGLNKGLGKNHGEAELAGLKARLEQFAGMIKAVAPLPKGSVVSIDSLPGGVTRVALNGNALGRDIAGEDFYPALLRIWLGAKPAQDDLKTALLGG